jgi:hypothetical protein
LPDLIEVAGTRASLMRPEMLVEIEATAVVTEDA